LSTGKKVNPKHLSRPHPVWKEPPIIQSRRHGVIVEDDNSLSNSEFETEDSDDSGWTSEEISKVEGDGSPVETNGKSTSQGEGGGDDSEEEERKRRDYEMFAKLPRTAYTNLPEGVSGVGGVESFYDSPRARRGLLTQLLNPDPSIFPANHPYRMRFSSQGVTAHPRMKAPL